MNDLHKKLDEFALNLGLGISRKVSLEKTEECPVWSPFEEIWIESDEQMRQKLKDLKNTNK